SICKGALRFAASHLELQACNSFCKSAIRFTSVHPGLHACIFCCKRAIRLVCVHLVLQAGILVCTRAKRVAGLHVQCTPGDVGLAGEARTLEKNGSRFLSTRSATLLVWSPSYSS